MNSSNNSPSPRDVVDVVGELGDDDVDVGHPALLGHLDDGAPVGEIVNRERVEERPEVVVHQPRLGLADPLEQVWSLSSFQVIPLTFNE